jgi:hypothetical protein
MGRVSGDSLPNQESLFLPSDDICSKTQLGLVTERCGKFLGGGQMPIASPHLVTEKIRSIPPWQLHHFSD